MIDKHVIITIIKYFNNIVWFILIVYIIIVLLFSAWYCAVL